MNLFEAIPGGELPGRPLADRMRPKSLEEYVGQEHILAPAGVMPSSHAEDLRGHLRGQQ